MKKFRYLLLFIIYNILLFNISHAQTKVACIGNSITENYVLPPSEKYPAQLQKLLGSSYEVRNYGIGGRTMLKKGDLPYWNENYYKEALQWNPDIVIIKMGTNDGKPGNWKHKDEFEKDYVEFVRSFQSLNSNPKIFICYPIPTINDNFLPLNDEQIVSEIIPKVKSVAEKTKSRIIDLHTPMLGREDFVYDKVHPNKEGATVMARVVAKSICPNRRFPKPASGKKLNIIFIGNSITEASYLEKTPPEVTAMYLDSLGYEVRYANCGISGFTSVDFQPSTDAFKKVITAANEFSLKDGLLLFSIKLGTNDSASSGTNGAPVSPIQFRDNLQTIIDTLHHKYPQAKIMLHYPTWYSPSTQNNATYLQEGLDRLISYKPIIKSLVKKNKKFVTLGDTRAFDIFKKNHKQLFENQSGKSGIYYLHPNAEGADLLGTLWAKNIEKLVKKK